MTDSRGKLVLLTAGAAMVLALAGCSFGGSADPGASAPPAPSSQSKADACSALSGALGTLSTDINSSVQSLQSDPTAAVAALREVVDEFDAALDGVTNEEVLAVGTKASDSLGDFVTVIEGALADPASASDSLLDSVTTVQTDMLAMVETCKP